MCIGLARQSNALLKEEGWEIDIDFYVMSVLSLLKLIQVCKLKQSVVFVNQSVLFYMFIAWKLNVKV